MLETLAMPTTVASSHHRDRSVSMMIRGTAAVFGAAEATGVGATTVLAQLPPTSAAMAASAARTATHRRPIGNATPDAIELERC